MEINESSVSEVVSREFVAVVLAGFGNGLLPLTASHGDEPCPKALLPVANKPMLEYVLNWIDQSGIKDVLLICPAIHRAPIYHHVSSSASSLRIDLQTFDETAELAAGTCTLLRHFANRITKEFVIIPTDFIPPPSLPLSKILDRFRSDTISSGSIATTCWIPAYHPDKMTPAEEWGGGPTPTPIVYERENQQLLYVDGIDDRDKNSQEIELKMSLLIRYPRTTLTTKYQDSHLYVCKRSVLDLLQAKRHFESFSDEFLPWLCKLQYQQAKREKYNDILRAIPTVTDQSRALAHSTRLQDHILKEHSLNGVQSPNNESSPIEPDSTIPKVGIVIHQPNKDFAIRANNLLTYLEINRWYLSKTSYTLPSDPKNRSLIDQKVQISSDSIVGEFTQISERTNIKRSVIGRHCVIGKMVKITGCILLDHCVIADGAKLEHCILGKNTTVGAKAELHRCVTQAGYEIQGGEISKGERLEVSDWATARHSDGSDDDDDDDDDDAASNASSV
ncbi:hypothetical protein AX16_006950 [Volvariella volvacea WC 439]|nr:hypothetical protein AX16_006950 [Volvariella volvacea WC 439]